MDCRRTTKFLAAGEDAGNPELEKHLATCTSCRQLRLAILDLERLGRDQRQADLSLLSVRETQLQASAMLARRLKQGVDISASPPSRFMWRPILAACAAAVLVAAVAFTWFRFASGTVPLSASEMAALDARIELLSRHVGDDLQGFRDRHRDNEVLTGVEAISASLRIDIASSAMHINME